MIPFRDANPSSRLPIVTVTLIILNVIFFIYELSLGSELESFLYQMGVIPHSEFKALPYLTSQFFHGGWLHLIGNMMYLWIFGDNIEDRLGHVRFLFFYLACGIVAGLAHTHFNPNSTVPAIGASGAIAGVLGAYLISFPNARVHTLVPFGFHYEVIELPAVVVLGFWFVFQFLSGTASIAVTAENTGGVAWWAHIGGFVAGILLLFLLQPQRRNAR